MTIVLDASAMIAYLRSEAGADLVEWLLRDPGHQLFAHAVNLGDVFYDFHRSGGRGEASRALRDLDALQVVERGDMDREFWQAAASLKAVHRRISLADCFAITLANRLGAKLATSDHHEFGSVAAQGLCRVQFVR